MHLRKDKLLVILGPTSTGKTDLGLRLAKKFNGELISCDSRQVYKGLDIGTGKLPGSSWMLDVCDPKDQYSVAEYVKDANKVINDILEREKLPIIVGGTGFYLKALLEGLPNLEVPIDLRLRRQLNNLTVEELQKKLSNEKLAKMNGSDRQNPRRLIRAIELKGWKSIKEFKIYDSLKIGLTAPREILYQRSDSRIIDRIKQGMIEEAKRLRKKGLGLERMKQLGLEYGILADYLSGKINTKEDLVKTLQLKIHGYIKRQQTWFKKGKNINWFDITEKNYAKKVEKIITKWYHQSYATEN